MRPASYALAFGAVNKGGLDAGDGVPWLGAALNGF